MFKSCYFMKKLVGLILIIVGFVLLLLNLSPVKDYVGKFIPEVSQNYILSVGVILVLIGLFLARGKKKLREDLLPIFEGKKVVGYQKGKK